MQTLTIGSPALAAELESSNPDMGRLPKGFRLIGRGYFRDAYMGPDGFVYKILDPGCEDPIKQYQQDVEIQAHDRLAHERREINGNTWRVARMAKYGGVIVSEYVPIAVEVSDYECDEAEVLFEIGDVHSENVRMSEDGEYVLIDLGGCG
jgi:hypothetical protein